MYCEKCGQQLNNEKFCNGCGQSNGHSNISKNTNPLKNLSDFMWKKRVLIKKWLKNIALFFCVYFVSITIFNAIRSSYYDDNTFVALAATILVIYIWRKISKRYNL